MYSSYSDILDIIYNFSARWPLARWPVGPLARWPIGPLAHWPVGPLARWADGRWGFGRWASALAWPTLPCLLVSSLLFSTQPEKFLTTKNVDHFQVNPGVWLATGCADCHAKAAMCAGRPCGQSAHADRSGFFGTWWFEDTTPMSITNVVLVALCVYVGGAWAL